MSAPLTHFPYGNPLAFFARAKRTLLHDEWQNPAAPDVLLARDALDSREARRSLGTGQS